MVARLLRGSALLLVLWSVAVTAAVTLAPPLNAVSYIDANGRERLVLLDLNRDFRYPLVTAHYIRDYTWGAGGGRLLLTARRSTTTDYLLQRDPDGTAQISVVRNEARVYGAPDGNHILLAYHDAVQWVNPETAVERTYLLPDGPPIVPRVWLSLSSDRALLWTRANAGSAGGMIYRHTLLNLATGNTEPVGDLPCGGELRALRSLPGGARLFMCDRADTIFVERADGVQILLTATQLGGPGMLGNPQLSPDGTHILLVYVPRDRAQVIPTYIVHNLETGTSQPALADFTAVHAQWVPLEALRDGR